MSEISNLSFFSVTKYNYHNKHICDFSTIPRPHYCMGYVFDGEGEFVFEKKSVTVKKGDIIFVPVGSTYISTWKGNPEVNYISVHFSFEFKQLFSRSKKIEIQKIHLENTEILEKLYTDLYNKKDSQFASLAYFYDILSRVYPELKYTKMPKIDSRISKAIDYIEHHISEKLKIDELSSLCNMSSSHFYSCFKNSVGYSPIEYKNRVAIRKSELLLIEEDEKSIDEISGLVGFNSSVYFREVFKKITGKTPTEYRNYNKTAEVGK